MEFTGDDSLATPQPLDKSNINFTLSSLGKKNENEQNGRNHQWEAEQHG